MRRARPFALIEINASFLQIKRPKLYKSEAQKQGHSRTPLHSQARWCPASCPKARIQVLAELLAYGLPLLLQLGTPGVVLDALETSSNRATAFYEVRLVSEAYSRILHRRSRNRSPLAFRVQSSRLQIRTLNAPTGNCRSMLRSFTS